MDVFLFFSKPLTLTNPFMFSHCVRLRLQIMRKQHKQDRMSLDSHSAFRSRSTVNQTCGIKPLSLLSDAALHLQHPLCGCGRGWHSLPMSFVRLVAAAPASAVKGKRLPTASPAVCHTPRFSRTVSCHSPSAVKAASAPLR